MLLKAPKSPRLRSILILAIGIQVLFFQNCSGGFRANSIFSSNAQAVGAVCTPDTTLFNNSCYPNEKTCAVENGTGSQFFSSGSYGPCVLSTCNTGFQPINGYCMATDGTIDPIDFFVTQHQDIALNDGTPGFNINQVVDTTNHKLYLMKWGPKSFLDYTWDDNFIYFLEEHENDYTGAPPTAINYSFSPGYWFRRKMKVGDSLDGTSGGSFVTTMTTYDTPFTCNVKTQASYSMRTVLESFTSNYALGGDLGNLDVIVLRIEQNGLFSEKEMYARGWGLVQWQHCLLDGSSCDQTVTWNYKSQDPPIRPDRSASCLPSTQN
jgi:hypothetical protein